MNHRNARRTAALATGCLAVACTSGPWDVAALTLRHPELAEISSHRLGDLTPYLLPTGDTLLFFLCHWPAGAAIPVSLPGDASDEERSGLAAVMRAWEGAGLGIRFTTGAPPGAGIDVTFIDPEGGTTGGYAANTITDCAVDPGTLDRDPGGRLRAQLVTASIHVWRGGYDNVGRKVPHSNAEFLGSALHEFGHALGYQGHANVGRTVMVREIDSVRWAGQALLKDKPFEDATLRALYAIPSGTIVKRVPIDEARTRRVGIMARIAAERGLRGPLVRVGDVDGQLAWRSDDGREYALRIHDVRKLLRSSEAFWLRPTSAANELLDAI
ncbi:MAG: hypothetical protein ACE5FL_09440 [Myxococcota bacterium]